MNVHRFLNAVLVGFLAVVVLQWAAPTRGQAVGFQPGVSALPSGSILNVTPAVSADRRYVRLGLDVTFNQVIGFTTYSVPAAVSGGGAGMLGPLGGLAGGGGGAGRLGGGMPSVGVGGPAVAEDAPGFFLGVPSGDPFDQATPTRAGARQPEANPRPREAQPETRADNSDGNLVRSQRPKAHRAQSVRKPRKRPAASRTANRRSQGLPEPLFDDFSFDP